MRAHQGNYQDQLDALQGVWHEHTDKARHWIICGNIAETPGPPGRNRHFTLVEGPNGELLWGTRNKYMLDSDFTGGESTATWVDDKGRTAFSWKFVRKISSRDAAFEEFRKHEKGGPRVPKPRRPQTSSRPSDDSSHSYMDHGADSMSQTQLWLDPGQRERNEERRIDPADGGLYSYQEMRLHYTARYRKQEFEAYWHQECIPAPKGLTGSAAKAKGKGGKDSGKSAGQGYWNDSSSDDWSRTKGKGKPMYGPSALPAALRVKSKGKGYEVFHDGDWPPKGGIPTKGKVKGRHSKDEAYWHEDMDKGKSKGMFGRNESFKGKGKNWDEGYWHEDMERKGKGKSTPSWSEAPKSKGNSWREAEFEDNARQPASKGKGKPKGKGKNWQEANWHADFEMQQPEEETASASIWSWHEDEDEVEKRVDPTTGNSYTFEEMQKFYGEGIHEWWDTLRPAMRSNSAGKGKGKSKSKGKTKGKGKMEEVTDDEDEEEEEEEEDDFFEDEGEEEDEEEEAEQTQSEGSEDIDYRKEQRKPKAKMVWTKKVPAPATAEDDDSKDTIDAPAVDEEATEVFLDTDAEDATKDAAETKDEIKDVGEADAQAAEETKPAAPEAAPEASPTPEAAPAAPEAAPEVVTVPDTDEAAPEVAVAQSCETSSNAEVAEVHL